MVEFVMPTCEELVDQLRAQRRFASEVFKLEGWTPGARKVLRRMDRLIARYQG